jgi:hypothetical protein
VLAVILFHVVFPAAPEARYSQAFVAPMIAFVVPGAATILGWVRRRPASQFAYAGVAIGAAVLYAAVSFHFVPQPRFGFRQVAGWLRHRGGGTPLRALILSDASGEGAFEVEVASPEVNRPKSTVVRGGKLLANADWVGNHYSLTYPNAADALRDIEALGLRYIVLDRTRFDDGRPHCAQILGLIDGGSNRLRRVFGTNGGTSRVLEVYEVVNAHVPATKRVTYRLDYTLGRSVSE